MSRIFGCVGPDAARRVRAAAAVFDSHGAARILEGPGMAVGWVGRHDAGSHVAQVDGLTLVMDAVLIRRDALPPGTGDAERVLRLYLERGIEGVAAACEGDFAIAIHDAQRHSLWLLRDRLGVKPLYHAALPDGAGFASQPRGLLAMGVPAAADPSYVARVAASHYRTFDNDPERSPYLGIAQLPAAHYLDVLASMQPLRRYWALSARAESAEAPEDLAHHYRAMLLDAVGQRLARAGRPAFMLSGGMDSSSVLAAAVAITGEPQHAFSSVYDDPTFDERHDIQPMLSGHVARWEPILVDRPDVFALIERMVALHDEPVATATWLSHFLLCAEVAGRGFDTLFGGLGGDELNAGEYEYFFCHFADIRAAGDERRFHDEVRWWARHHDHPVYVKNLAVAEETLSRCVDPATPGRCVPDRVRMLRYVDVLEPEYAASLREFEPIMDEPFDSYLRNRTYQDLFRETTPCCLRAEDRHTTAAGLGHADPFLDHRLAEFMFTVPNALKIRDGVTKRLLREAMRGLLPEETRTRIAKTGWNAPAHLWFTGEGADQLRDMVTSRAFADRGIYRPQRVVEIIDEHERIVMSDTARENHMMFLWQVVNVETWLRQLDRGSQATAAI